MSHSITLVIPCSKEQYIWWHGEIGQERQEWTIWWHGEISQEPHEWTIWTSTAIDRMPEIGDLISLTVSHYHRRGVQVEVSGRVSEVHQMLNHGPYAPSLKLDDIVTLSADALVFNTNGDK